MYYLELAGRFAGATMHLLNEIGERLHFYFDYFLNVVEAQYDQLNKRD